MSKDHDHDHDDASHGATTIRASKGGGAGKWLLGAIGALVVAGGGYVAWKNMEPGQTQNAELAYNDDAYGDDPLRAGPLEQSDDTLAETASTDSIASPDEDQPIAAAPRRSAARAAPPVPEETIGVTPASVSTEETTVADGSDIVVTAPPRPVWVRTPTERRLTRLYPARALERGREGEARLHCTVLEGGSLDCVRAEETPGGFGTAAMRVARTLRHASTRADGSDATGTPVNLRVVFRIDDETRRG